MDCELRGDAFWLKTPVVYGINGSFGIGWSGGLTADLPTLSVSITVTFRVKFKNKLTNSFIYYRYWYKTKPRSDSGGIAT